MNTFFIFGFLLDLCRTTKSEPVSETGMNPYMVVEYTPKNESVRRRDKIVFRLFWDVTPKTAKNFAELIKGFESPDGKTYSYKNTTFHRIIDGFVIQGGDITEGNGTGGMSIYGRSFKDENFKMKHSRRGLLSMANRGKNTNSSQFFITLDAFKHLDGKHVVFGEVKDQKSLEAVMRISETKAENGKPAEDVLVVETGFEADSRDDNKSVL